MFDVSPEQTKLAIEYLRRYTSVQAYSRGMQFVAVYDVKLKLVLSNNFGPLKVYFKTTNKYAIEDAKVMVSHNAGTVWYGVLGSSVRDALDGVDIEALCREPSPYCCIGRSVRSMYTQINFSTSAIERVVGWLVAAEYDL